MLVFNAHVRHAVNVIFGVIQAKRQQSYSASDMLKLFFITKLLKPFKPFSSLFSSLAFETFDSQLSIFVAASYSLHKETN